jgi:hypothetical protein
VKYWLDKLATVIFRIKRLQWYVGIVQMMMVFALFIDKYGFRWWYLFILPLMYIIHLFEKFYGLPTEQGISLRSNPEWNKRWNERD